MLSKSIAFSSWPLTGISSKVMFRITPNVLAPPPLRVIFVCLCDLNQDLCKIPQTPKQFVNALILPLCIKNMNDIRIGINNEEFFNIIT